MSLIPADDHDQPSRELHQPDPAGRRRRRTRLVVAVVVVLIATGLVTALVISQFDRHEPTTLDRSTTRLADSLRAAADEQRRADARRVLETTLVWIDEIDDLTAAARDLDSVAARTNPLGPAAIVAPQSWRSVADRWLAVQDLWRGRCTNLAGQAALAHYFAASIVDHLARRSPRTGGQLASYLDAAARAVNAVPDCADRLLDH